MGPREPRPNRPQNDGLRVFNQARDARESAARSERETLEAELRLRQEELNAEAAARRRDATQVDISMRGSPTATHLQQSPTHRAQPQ